MKKGEKVRSSTESTQPYPIGHQPLASHPTLMSTRGALHEQTAALDRRWQRAVPAGKKINSPSPTRGQIEQDNKPKPTQPAAAATLAHRGWRRHPAAAPRGQRCTSPSPPRSGGESARHATPRERHGRKGTTHGAGGGEGGRTPPATPGGRRAGVSRGVPIVPPRAPNLPATAGRTPTPANDAEERRRCGCQMGATATALATKNRRPWVSQSDAAEDRAHLVGSEAATSAPS